MARHDLPPISASTFETGTALAGSRRDSFAPPARRYHLPGSLRASSPSCREGSIPVSLRRPRGRCPRPSGGIERVKPEPGDGGSAHNHRMPSSVVYSRAGELLDAVVVRIHDVDVPAPVGRYAGGDMSSPLA